jgi:hypothetical protein
MKHSKHNKSCQAQDQRPSGAPQPAAVEESKPDKDDFAPSADEVARRAYFSYVNEGSPPGRDVRHWLAAEAELTSERNLTRLHAFHNKT